ncbi:unnamed protein product [Somion occarium]|uniref:Hemerythrin-like domain-containing protein n=1 Tax=Somion occarium TaxID=3059160 RepID=A0ABP1E3R6_9APHY
MVDKKQAPQDTFDVLQWNMIHAHDVFKAGCDSILRHLDNPPRDDLANFLGYCLAWAESIIEHHDAEEKIVFPFLNTKLDFSGEIEQHKAVHAPLKAMVAMIHEAQADLTKFDPQQFKELVVPLRVPLFNHLDDEVSHIGADSLKVFDEPALRKMCTDMDSYSKSHGDPFMIVPFMRSHTPPEFKDHWPVMPWVLRKLVVPILALRHSGYWKFSPYAVS